MADQKQESYESADERPPGAPNTPDNRPDADTPEAWQKFWDRELDGAERRLKDYHRRGTAIVKRYLDERAGSNAESLAGDDDDTCRLNLFYKNTRTLLAMLYGSTPRTDVKREHADPDDDIARVAAYMYQRLLQAEIEGVGEDFSTMLRAALQDRLLSGQGLCRVRYEYTTEKQQVPALPGGEPQEMEVLVDERAPLEYVYWQDVMWGWCRTWAHMPWLSFDVYLTYTEAVKRFGADKARTLDYKPQNPDGSEMRSSEGGERDQQSTIHKALVREIWHKETRKVYWHAKGQDEILDCKPDPLQLGGFWPCPRPMTANLTTSKFMPHPDFLLAQDLYNEIDLLQTRIRIITKAIKVVGVYDASTQESVGRMLLEGNENQLIPVDNWAMLAEKGGIKGSIDWYPVQDVVQVLNTLITSREQTISLLYEVTGLSDIMRGANTQQYTSDGTQQMKAKMGSIDVQALQDDFARFASDLESLKLEVISRHFRPESILKQANAGYLPQADRPYIGQAIQLMKSPDVRWRVDIRPESIAMVDYAQLKNERTEFLTSMATYLQSAQAVVKVAPQATPLILQLLQWGMAGFRGSEALEGTMDRMIDEFLKNPPQGQEGDNQDAAKQQAEIMKLQIKQQGEQALEKLKTQNAAMLEDQEQRNKERLEQLSFNNEMQRMMQDFNNSLRVIAENLGADLQVEQAQSTFAIAEEEVEHRNTMAEQRAKPNGRTQ